MGCCQAVECEVGILDQKYVTIKKLHSHFISEYMLYVCIYRGNENSLNILNYIS
jgi:hypothetical protein